MNQEKWFDFLLAFKDKPIKIQSEIEKLYEVKSIVGFDILDYSQYDLTKQTLIPSLVQNLLAETTEACLKLESSLFGAQKEEFKKSVLFNRVDTGDGGFVVLDNPFLAITFLMYLNLFIRKHNVFAGLKSNIYHPVGKIEMRFVLT